MSLSDTFETHTLKYLLTSDSVTRPTAWYVALCTSDPTDSALGTEVSGGGYARQSVAFTVSGNNASNTSAIEFPEATANYGTVVAVMIMPASTGGTASDMIVHAQLTTDKSISTGDIFRIPAGDLEISIDQQERLMGILTDEWEVKLLKHIFGHTKLDIPGNLYLGLHSGTPTEASPSTGELSGSGYSRVHLVDNVQNSSSSSSSSQMHTSFGFGTNDSLTNTSAIDFAEATGSWGTVSYYSVWDDATATTAANCLMIGALSSGVAVGSGDQFRIGIGEFDLTFPAKMGMGSSAMSSGVQSTTVSFINHIATEWRRQVARRLGFINKPWSQQNVSGSGYNYTTNYDWSTIVATNIQPYNIAVNNRNSYLPSVSLAYWDDSYSGTAPNSSGGSTTYQVIGNALYLGLYKSDPGSNPTNVATGSTGELSGAGYVRQQLINYSSSSTPNYNSVFGTPATSSGVSSIANTSAIAFPEATSDWGTITHWGIYRGYYHPTNTSNGGSYRVSEYGSGSGGGYNPARYPFLTGALTTARTVNSGDVLRFGIGDFVIKLD